LVGEQSAALQTVRIAAETCEESLEVMHMHEWLRRKELPLWYALCYTHRLGRVAGDDLHILL
jgi:hypothetical protein